MKRKTFAAFAFAFPTVTLLAGGGTLLAATSDIDGGRYQIHHHRAPFREDQSLLTTSVERTPVCSLARPIPA
jgi:hypothetical protein